MSNNLQSSVAILRRRYPNNILVPRPFFGSVFDYIGPVRGLKFSLSKAVEKFGWETVERQVHWRGYLTCRACCSGFETKEDFEFHDPAKCADMNRIFEIHDQ